MQNTAQPSAELPLVAKGRKQVDTQTNDALWAMKAIKEELANIAQCHGDNPHRPDSEWWKSVIRIASILKGSGKAHYNPSRVLSAIHQNSPSTLRTKGDRNKDIDYLFGRAFNAARPRYRLP